jgi:drug/metabolite transporter (DMT)-like permease
MKQKWLADSGLLFVTFIWGSTFVIVQDAIASIPPLAFNGWRFLSASLFLLLFVLSFKQKQPIRVSSKMILTGIVLGTLLFIGYGTQTVALLYTTSSKTAFITGLSVVVVPLFSWLLLKQIPKKAALIGVVISTVGLYFLTDLNHLSFNKGDLLAFFCAMAFGLHIIVTAKVTHSYSSMGLTITQLLTVSLLSFIGGIILKGVRITFSVMPFQHPMVLFSCLFTALFATAVAFLLQTSLQRYTPPTHVGIIFIMEPVFAAITALIFTDETMSLMAILGGLLIILGMLAAEWPTKKKAIKQAN